MLVLSRKKGEEIMINDNIKIVIVDICSGGKVKLGVEAPKDVSVHRSEVYEAIQQEQKASQEKAG